MAGEVLSRPERRRRWSAEEKAGILVEVMRPGAKVRILRAGMGSAAAFSTVAA